MFCLNKLKLVLIYCQFIVLTLLKVRSIKLHWYEYITAICKSQNEESWNGISGIMGTPGIRVGTRRIRVRTREIRVGTQEIKVGMWGIVVRMLGMWGIHFICQILTI